MQKLDILAIGVHPDDVELGASGTLLQHIALGHSVGLLDLTRGELGTRGSVAIRLAEATAAASLMGAIVRENVAMADGFFEHTEENLLKIIRVVRRYQPSLVLANAIRDRHPDHARAAKLTADACFLSGLRRIETFEDDGTAQECWRPSRVFHYVQDEYIEPDFVFDITPFMEKKLELVRAFKSQFYDPNSEEPSSPISSREFMEFVVARARELGRPAGFEFAEGFNVSKTLGVKNLFQIS